LENSEAWKDDGMWLMCVLGCRKIGFCAMQHMV